MPLMHKIECLALGLAIHPVPRKLDIYQNFAKRSTDAAQIFLPCWISLAQVVSIIWRIRPHGIGMVYGIRFRWDFRWKGCDLVKVLSWWCKEPQYRNLKGLKWRCRQVDFIITETWNVPDLINVPRMTIANVVLQLVHIHAGGKWLTTDAAAHGGGCKWQVWWGDAGYFQGFSFGDAQIVWPRTVEVR